MVKVTVKFVHHYYKNEMVMTVIVIDRKSNDR